MSDRELLEQAAKAAGIEGHYREYVSDETTLFTFFVGLKPWNPLTDDGHALRLVVKLELNVDIWTDEVIVVGYNGLHIVEELIDDPYAATRRAIVRAAAEIGKEMQ